LAVGWLAVAMATSPWTAELRALPADGQHHLNVAVTLRFVGGDVGVLDWQTPMNGIVSNIFDVRDERGVSAEYIGMIAKRVWPPSSDAFTYLGGSSVTFDNVDLSLAYSLRPLTTYTVTFRSSLSWAKRGSLATVVANADEVVSNAAVVTSSAFLQVAVPPSPNVKYTRPWQCTNNDAAVVRQATNNTVKTANTVWNAISQGQSMNNYVTWFGQQDNVRQQRVVKNFQTIWDYMRNDSFTVYCRNAPGCSPNTYAYVYPNDPYRQVHLCDVFWASSTVPTQQRPWDSMINTMLHEVSHFTVIAGTDDIAYGTSACMNLARQQPASAVRNADNHGYMVESFWPK